ncbi:MAG: hypothetical protein KDJ43_13605 [Rhizobiaceae bacterium]|nr:hypothetical protein [Rhizobiaceae bacterium]MCB2066423.1 hypothetical protein [Erythrobacter sp.]
MFEGKPPVAHDSRSSATGVMPEDALCELRWSDLVARLAAARELRAELARVDDAALASFDADSARWLAHQHDGYHDEHHHEGLHGAHDQGGVNPDDLGNGKAECGTSGAYLDGEAPAIRGNA